MALRSKGRHVTSSNVNRSCARNPGDERRGAVSGAREETLPRKASDLGLLHVALMRTPISITSLALRLHAARPALCRLAITSQSPVPQVPTGCQRGDLGLPSCVHRLPPILPVGYQPSLLTFPPTFPWYSTTGCGGSSTLVARYFEQSGRQDAAPFGWLFWIRKYHPSSWVVSMLRSSGHLRHRLYGACREACGARVS